MRPGDDETSSPKRAPKYSLVERERRWLVDPLRRPDLAGLPFTLIEDRYLDETRLRLRRMTDRRTGARTLKLTKKYDAVDPCARPIVTAYLDDAEFNILAALPAMTLTKRRYAVADGPVTFSLDQFLGPLAGLELAEIEWPDAAGLRGLPSPSWAVREVSDEPRYQGGSLCRFGAPEN